MRAESATPCVLSQQCHVHGAGTAEAASNAETTMTQLVQEYTIRAQVRALCKKSGIRIDRTEHVANSLGHLAAVVDQLNSLDHPLKVPVISCHPLLCCMADVSNWQGARLGLERASESTLAPHVRGWLQGNLVLPCQMCQSTADMPNGENCPLVLQSYKASACASLKLSVESCMQILC